MRADDRAERDDQLELRLRAPLAHERLELGGPLGSRSVRDGQPIRGLVPRLRLERRGELGESLSLSPHPLHRLDLALLDRENRLDLEQRAGERGRLPDAAAALEELERVDREQEPSLTPIPLDERIDLLVARTALQPPLDREREHRD